MSFQEYRHVSSPVWDDHFLDEDDVAFNDFHKKERGVFDSRVFLQDVYWVNIDGVPFFLTEMSPEYLLNVQRFLMYNAHTFFVDFKSDDLHKISRRNGFDNFNGNMEEWSQKWGTISPEEWCENTVLYKKLRELLV